MAFENLSQAQLNLLRMSFLCKEFPIQKCRRAKQLISTTRNASYDSEIMPSQRSDVVCQVFKSYSRKLPVCISSMNYGICDRKITKFVTEKHLQEEPDRKKSADECVALVRSRIQAYRLDCLWNADWSRLEYEMRPGRTLDLVGAKHVLALTRSENSMTHSYTVMMCVSPGARKYLSVLFITLQKDKGVFGPIVKRTMFRSSNLHVTASTSGKMTKELFVEWCEKVFFPQMDGHCLFLEDSWPTFADQEAVEEVKPEELEYEMIMIPPKVTGQIQPLDVVCFRMYKGYFRKVSNWLFLNDQPVQVHHRDVILKLHSLIYQQFISRRFENLIAQAWHLSGYIDRSYKYVNPAEFCFDRVVGPCERVLVSVSLVAVEVWLV
ncbi:hypothetical protein RvY_14345 [Ramazzottius varieornatus]|uniref:DDE-1 domain-containing protein n=1 Tax=Ramazzottius varieornatus TaxID=947166 RepID=A0A1D1VQY9_RAMVA|nr:hypothetical protein RvY_14345 [Ramazzottius varieornatus]